MKALLAEHYGIRGEAITRITRGHTNESFAIGAHLVARRSWAGKPLARIEREERVLDALGAPRIVTTARGETHVRDGERTVHVFERCAGEPGPSWLERGDTRTIRLAMENLARLHARLASLPIAGAGAWTWLRERLDRVRARPLPLDAPSVLARIASILDAAPDLGAVQWLHGDYHLGNLLFEGDRVVAVDLDDTGVGSAAGEAAMALFALSRRNVEERFVWDAHLWEAGRAVYPASLPSPETLAPVFCAHQALVHLEAAQNGWWKLEPGIGFWPCWNALT